MKKTATPWRSLSCRISKWRCRPAPSRSSSCCGRHSKLAIAALKEMYKDEAQHVAHDITAKLCALPLDRAVAADSESLPVDDEPLFPPRDPDEVTQ
jgi:hypothetical protein